jgi:hypothetical protein
LLHEYLSRLPTLDVSDLVLAKDLAFMMLDLLGGTEPVHVTCLPVAGLVPERAPITVGDVSLRDITPDEVGMLHRNKPSLPIEGVLMMPMSPPSPRERLVLEVRNRYPRSESPRDDGSLERVLLAFRLFGYEPYGTGNAWTYAEPKYLSIRGGRGVQLQFMARDGLVTRETLGEVVRLAERLKELLSETAPSAHRLAIQRFESGASRDDWDGAIVDYTVCLEAILCPGAQTSEVKHRFRLHGAWFLGSTYEERGGVFRELGRIYDARSSLVHGTRSGTDIEIDVHSQARSLAAHVIRKAIEVGWPSRESLEAMSLGIGVPPSPD